MKNLFWTEVQRQLNGKKTVFSIYSTGTIRYSFFFKKRRERKTYLQSTFWNFGLTTKIKSMDH